jgi:3-oxoadipate enol-lactonase
MTERPIEASAADGTVLRASLHESGQPRRIVLVHSLALDRTVWRFVIDELTDHADVLALDCRGHGDSDRTAGPYTVELMAEDLAAVLDAAAWRQAVVAGCSMGGCVAQAFAAAHPDRTSGLVLIDTTAWYGPTALEDWRQRADKAKAEGLASQRDFQVTRWFGDAFAAEHTEVVDDLMDRFVANDVDCYAATCAMLGAADLRGAIDHFKGPATVLVGEQDGAAPPAMADDLARRLGAPAPTVLPGARHLTPLERPREIGEAIAALAAQPAAATVEGGRE